MPALSKKQQRFFGIVRAIQKGEQAPTTPETAKAARDMKKGDVKDFASTKHKAQKMVLEGEKEWLILDLEELHEYIRREKKTEVYINDLISDLEWTIFLAKN